MSNAIFNPLEKDLEELPTIFGFNNGGGGSFLSAELIAEDGTHLGGHACSQEGYMPGDLGITVGSSPRRHEGFKRHYPDGYRMEFVSLRDVEGHKEINAAIALNAKMGEEARPCH